MRQDTTRAQLLAHRLCLRPCGGCMGGRLGYATFCPFTMGAFGVPLGGGEFGGEPLGLCASAVAA